MTVAKKREQLKTILDAADDNKIKVLYSLWEDIAQDGTTELTDEQLLILEQRRNDMLSNKNVITDWEKMHEDIRKKRVA